MCVVPSRRGPLALEGEYLWTLKDHIDRVWMSAYVNLRKIDMAAAVGGLVESLDGDKEKTNV